MTSRTGNPDNLEAIHNLYKTSYRPAFMKRVSNAFDDLLNIIMSIVPILFSKVLYTTWIPLFVLIYAIKKKNGLAMIALIPVLLNSAVLAVGPIVLPRYMVNSVYLAPMVVMGMFIKKRAED